MARLTYERLQRDGMTDAAVCRGLHEAMRHMRQQWLEEDLVTNTGEARKYAKEEAKKKNASRDARHGTMMENEISIMHWVPYVHYGA